MATGLELRVCHHRRDHRICSRRFDDAL